MTAKEMFEELGYTMSSNDWSIDYWANSKKSFFIYKRICFDLVNKEFIAESDYDAMHIDMPTFKAIQKQLEELGWI